MTCSREIAKSEALSAGKRFEILASAAEGLPRATRRDARLAGAAAGPREPAPFVARFAAVLAHRTALAVATGNGAGMSPGFARAVFRAARPIAHHVMALGTERTCPVDAVLDVSTLVAGAAAVIGVGENIGTDSVVALLAGEAAVVATG